ncbi:MAG: 7-cyano-7-deazaguanine synthase QueC [Planctomycetaceae bacterium]
MSENRRAVLLLSGGLDSTTVLAIALAEGLDVTALSFRYGQNHVHEAEQAKRIAQKYDVDDHVIVDIDLGIFGASALTDDIAVPKHDNHEAIPEGIPVTYVPARNTIFLSYALAMAEVRRADCIMLGVNALDYSGYPDCRPEYVNSFERMANLATKRAIEGRRLEICAPLMNLTKAQIIEKGIALGVDYSLTTSCYDPDEDNRACGFCDACLLRRRGFEANGLEDPTIYQA